MTPPSIALIHGWGFPAAVWAPLRTALPADWAIHTPPLPGYDGTPLPATPEAAADALIADLRAARAVPADGLVLAGWSLGAQIVLLAAARHPDAVRGLVLIAATPRFLTAADWPHAVAPAVLDGFIAALADDPAALRSRFAALINQGDANARTIRRQLAALGDPPSTATLKRGLEWLRDSDLRPILPGITQPTLLIHGAADPLMPAKSARALAERLQNARVEWLSGAAHAPFLSDPAAVAAILTRFLAKPCR